MDTLKKKDADNLNTGMPAEGTKKEEVTSTATVKGPGIDISIVTGEKEGTPFLRLEYNTVLRGGLQINKFTTKDTTGRFTLEVKDVIMGSLSIDFGYPSHTEITGLIEKNGDAYEVAARGSGVYKRRIYTV